MATAWVDNRTAAEKAEAEEFLAQLRAKVEHVRQHANELTPEQWEHVRSLGHAILARYPAPGAAEEVPLSLPRDQPSSSSAMQDDDVEAVNGGATLLQRRVRCWEEGPGAVAPQTGRVTSWDQESQEHTVTYDGGTVKRQRLVTNFELLD